MSGASSLNTPVHVAVGIILDGAGNVLISRRPADKHQGGLWEFPGGKVDPGETVGDALRRELAEELGITVLQAEPWRTFPFTYPDKAVYLDVWKVTAIDGVPHGREGQPVKWAPLAELTIGDFPAPNRFILNALRLPPRYLITPAPVGDLDDWLMRLEAALVQGIRLVQVRSENPLDDATVGHLFPAVALLANRYGAKVLVSRRLCEVTPPGWQGMHWPASLLKATEARPDGLLGVSCHNPAELKTAQDIGADFAVLGPVCTTASHPDQPPLGWATFRAWTADLSIPVYAIGGQDERTGPMAETAGAQGIAAIRGLWPER